MGHVRSNSYKQILVMTIANTFAAKLGVAFVALAMALSMVAPAQAQTAEELQAQIDSLMATIAALQAQAGMTSPTASGNAYVFTRSLTIGAQGADVTALQQYLIGAGHVIPAGATGYFGTQTQAAVASWQSAHGVMPPAGYFGPISQAKYNALMAAIPSTPTTPTTPGGDDDDDDGVSLSGEASLGANGLTDGEDTDIEEGQEASPVAELNIEFDNGDARITRIDLDFSATGEQDPWKTFDEVSLWIDGDEVATKRANRESDWLSNETTLRMTGLDIVAMEGEEVEIVIAVTVQGSVKNLPATWTVEALNVRYTDADGVTSTDDLSDDTVDFIISEAGADDELIIKSSSDNPEATTLPVKASSNSSWTTVFAFDLDSDDSTNDIELNTVRVGLQTNDDEITDVVNNVRIVVDGQTFTKKTWNDSDGSQGEVDFDIDGGYAIDAGDRVTAEVQVQFKKLTANYAEGATIKATTTPAGYDVEGADDVTPTGSATGKTHTLRTSGANLKAGAMTTSKDPQTDTLGDEIGIFTLKFDVTAFEADLYIAKSAASSTGSAAGVSYRVTDGSGASAGTSTAQTASLSSNASSETGTDAVSRFVVNEGETKTFTLTVNYNPNNVNAFYGIQLYSLNFKTANTAAATVVQQLATPAEDFETDALAI